MNRSAFLCLILSLWCFAAEAADIIPVERDHRKWEQAKFGLTIALRPVLHLPGGEGPHPVAIIINSSAGAKDIFLHEWPKALNADGFAAVSLDTFTPRGIRSTTRDQSQISVFTMALDALAVARHLAGDPRLRADRMIVSGHSKGASTAVHLANAQFYERFHVRPVFAAGAVFSPDCFVQFPGSTTAFPIYALSGEKDDVTPPAYCLPLFARLNGNPHPAILEIIPGTWHSWSIDGPTVKYAPDLPNISHGPCATMAPFLMETPYRLRSTRTGEALSRERYRSHCAGGTGKTFGGGRENLPLAFNKAIDWLRKSGFSTDATGGR